MMASPTHRSTKVVVGVDGSGSSRAALAHALDETARRNARLRVVSVIVPPLPSPAPWKPPTAVSHVRAERVRQIRDVVNEVSDERPGTRGRVPVEVVAAIGAPAQVLLAESDGAALLVLGHRRHGALTSALLGSVGQHCVLHASCPVTIVRPPDGVR
jgi:nucleotide-binding universal stress UspA family protein